MEMSLVGLAVDVTLKTRWRHFSSGCVPNRAVLIRLSLATVALASNGDQAASGWGYGEL